jgi:HAE1 family hydrophobic/amphiphilic exporter-1
MTLFLMPTVYYIMNKNSDRREARAEARRQRIAEGISRKQAKKDAAENQDVASVGDVLPPAGALAPNAGEAL